MKQKNELLGWWLSLISEQNKKFIEETIKEAQTITHQDLPEFVRFTREWYDLVFSTEIRKRAKEFHNLKMSVFKKMSNVEQVPNLIDAVSFMFDKYLGVKLKSRKKAKSLSKKFQALIKLYLKTYSVLNLEWHRSLFGPSYGTVYESPSISKKQEKVLSELRKIVKEFREKVETVQKELKECTDTFSSEAMSTFIKLR